MVVWHLIKKERKGPKVRPDEFGNRKSLYPHFASLLSVGTYDMLKNVEIVIFQKFAMFQIILTIENDWFSPT